MDPSQRWTFEVKRTLNLKIWHLIVSKYIVVVNKFLDTKGADRNLCQQNEIKDKQSTQNTNLKTKAEITRSLQNLG